MGDTCTVINTEKVSHREEKEELVMDAVRDFLHHQYRGLAN